MNYVYIDKDRIKELYLKGFTYLEMASILNCDETTVSKKVRSMLETGELKKRTRVTSIHNYKPPKKVKVEEPDEGTGGIKCTKKVAKTCRYGLLNALDDGDKCNYCCVTGHCRTVQDGKSGYNDPRHCFCYERITKTAPRYKAKVHIDVKNRRASSNELHNDGSEKGQHQKEGTSDKE